MTVTEARAELPALLDAVEEGHEVTITRHGKPVAVLISPRRLRRHRLARHDAEVGRLHQMLEDARARPRPMAELPPVSRQRADEIVAWIDAGRDDAPQTQGDDPHEGA